MRVPCHSLRFRRQHAKAYTHLLHTELQKSLEQPSAPSDPDDALDLGIGLDLETQARQLTGSSPPQLEGAES